MNLNFTLIIEIVSFLILFFLLSRFLYKPVIEILDKRAQASRQALEQVQRSQKAAQALLENAKEELKNAKEQAVEILHRARLQADEDRKKILDEAKRQSQALLHSSRQQLSREVALAKAELVKELSHYSVTIAEKIIGREIKEQDHVRFIEEGMRQIAEN
jgi:F-type H+-transporting ATPase subunit b